MKRQHGIGLIEVVVGLGLLALAILGLNSLAISMIRGNLSARLTDEATRLAQSKIEQVRNAGYAAAQLGSTTEAVLSASGTPGLIFGRYTTIAAGPLPGTRTVTITMTWCDKGLRQTTFYSEIVQHADRDDPDDERDDDHDDDGDDDHDDDRDDDHDDDRDDDHDDLVR